MGHPERGKSNRQDREQDQDLADSEYVSMTSEQTQRQIGAHDRTPSQGSVRSLNTPSSSPARIVGLGHGQNASAPTTSAPYQIGSSVHRHNVSQGSAGATSAQTDLAHRWEAKHWWKDIAKQLVDMNMLEEEAVFAPYAKINTGWDNSSVSNSAIKKDLKSLQEAIEICQSSIEAMNAARGIAKEIGECISALPDTPDTDNGWTLTRRS